MANLIPPMLVEMQLDVGKIKQGLTDVNNNLTNFGQTVQKQSTFLTQFKNMAAGVFGGNILTQGMQGVQSAIRSAIADAQEYERQLAKTGAILQSTGNVAGVSVGHFKAMASSLEELTTVDENLILQSMNVLATFTQVRNVVGEGNDIFDQAAAAALDLATVMEGDLQGATVQLGKALNDPVKGMTALQKSGVTFSAEQKKMIKTLVESGDVMGAQKIILAEVKREFGGAGAAVGNTFAGGVARAKDKVADFTRDLVLKLQPILLAIGKTLGDLWNKYLVPVFNWINKNKEALLLFVGVLAAGYLAIKTYNAILLVSKAVQTAYAVAQVLMKGGQLASIASTNGLAASMLGLNAAMRANPIGLIVTLLGLVAAAFVYAWNNSKTFREIIIAIGKAGLTALSFIIEQVGNLAVGILKVVTGPMRLLLKGLDMLGVSAAGSVLKTIDGAIEGVGNFFDGAAKKVEGYKKTLDGLADKKITLPSFLGGTKEETPPTGAEAPDAGLTPDQIKAAAALAKKNASDIKKHKEEVVKIYAEMNKAVEEGSKKSAEALIKRDELLANARKKYADLAVKITNKKNDELKKNEDAWNKAYEKAYEANKKTLLKIDEDYAKKKVQIEKAYADKVASLQEKATADIAAAQISASDKLISIVEKSMDRLRNAFGSKTGFNLVEAFGKEGATGEQLLTSLTTQMSASKSLAEKAAFLQANGFTQTFIEQVVSAGPEVGNQLADSILNASPETIRALNASFVEMERVSAHGVDAIAVIMNQGGKLATEELMEAYNQVPIDLAKTLQNINALLIKDLASANSEYMTSLAEAAKARDEAIAEAKAALIEALDEADKALAEANKDTMDEFNKAIEENAQSLAETLVDIQLAYEEAVADIIQDTKDRLDTLTASLKEAADALKALGAHKAAADAIANSPTKTPTPVVPVAAKPTVYASGGRIDSAGNYNPFNPAMVGMTSGGVTVTQNITYPTASVTDISAGVISAIKFGATVGGK